MNESIESIIGRNVKITRKFLGLSLYQFSTLCGLSKTTVVNIENGKKGYNLKLLNSIIDFLNVDLSTLSSIRYQPDPNIRQLLIEKYRQSRPELYTALSSKPEIVYAIRYKLLREDYLNTPKEIREIRDYFNNLGWDYRGTSISTALNRMTDLVKIVPHSSKANTNTYLKK